MNELMQKPLVDAFSALYAIKMLRAMAIASDGGLSDEYNLVEFAMLLGYFIQKLDAAMTELEQCLYAS